MYADRVTAAMKHAIDETDRRREVQRKYNLEHGITPETVTRAILDVVSQSGERDYYAVPKRSESDRAAQKGRGAAGSDEHELMERMQALRQEMFLAAENLQFEKAARLRDELRKLQGDAGQSARSGSGEVVPLPKGRASKATARRTNTKSGQSRGGVAKKGPRRGSRA
jgi:excinuclease ABC subunit B